MGTQGDAGQFRTPRHIIDFIVAVVDPQKSERIHDPACGTAGFLISAYSHIQEANKRHRPGDSLTQSEKKNLPQNIIGCELDPGMVRLSLVNMYLHRISQPQIREYDTLTYDDLWDEGYDVILANPPFMTPKGGIFPHSRFAVQAKRSEVLFVDYIAEHLSLRGRAGVIVPEGIIFQSQRAYKELRRRLAEDWGLWAVVSLPAGVFNPYSGVKTSILFLDKTRAKGAEEILFVRVSADGFDLGAQRRTVVENDLPHVRKILSAWKRGEKLEDSEMALWTPKEKIAENGEYSLSAERYRAAMDYSNAKWPVVKLGEVCEEILSGGTPSTKIHDYWKGNIPWITSADIVDIHTIRPRRYINDIALQKSATNLIPKGNIIVVTRVGLGKLVKNEIDVCISQDSQGLILNPVINADFLIYVLRKEVQKFKTSSQGSTIQGVTKKQLESIKIPLPPLAVQEEIVAEVDGYQRVIDGARLAIANWKPTININPSWPKVKLGEVCEVNPKAGEPIVLFGKCKFVYIDIASVQNGGGNVSYSNLIETTKAPSRARRVVKENDVLISTVRPNLKAFAILKDIPSETLASTGFAVLRAKVDILPDYLHGIVFNETVLAQMINRMGKGSYPSINQKDVISLMIPLPPLAEQQRIVSDIVEEEKAIAACRHLIDSHEEKIRAKIAGLWGDG